MVAANSELKAQNNPFMEFAELCLAESPDLMVMRHDLRTVFNNWLKAEFGGREWSGKAVARVLQGAMGGVVGEKTKRGQVWVGVRFTEAALTFLPEVFGQAKPTLDELNIGLTPEIRERLGRPVKTKF
jgi:hypothetical protein